MELEELVQGVFDIYDQVKHQKRTMMEAIVVATLAFKIAMERTAKLQLRIPSIKVADDLIGILVNHSSVRLKTQISQAIVEVRRSFEDDGVCSHIAPPMELGRLVGLLSGYFGETMAKSGRQSTYVPDSNNYIALLAQQLPVLYNTIQFKTAAMGPGSLTDRGWSAIS
ncbi:unnamed protein product [Phytophthora lilii]|uniref:Unnamed protein product n=1 Tax=Phytophthora lilii TaxID=2077276 RepID=A0A9W6TWS1_9STRA|nr:unnamed protein product [Phytophthora lilii]